MDRIAAIADSPDGLFIKALPKADQLRICEIILKCPPSREVQLWARRVYLDLTDPEPAKVGTFDQIGVPAAKIVAKARSQRDRNAAATLGLSQTLRRLSHEARRDGRLAESVKLWGRAKFYLNLARRDWRAQ